MWFIFLFLVGHWIATKKHKIRLWCCHRIIPVILSNLYTSLAFPLYLGCEVVSESMVLCIPAVLTRVAVSSWLGSLPAVRMMRTHYLLLTRKALLWERASKSVQELNGIILFCSLFFKKTFFSILKQCSLSALSTQADYCSLLHSPVLYALLFILYLLLSRDAMPSIFYFFPPFTSLFFWSWQEKRRQSWGCSSGISFAWYQEYINTEHNRKEISREIGHVQALVEFRFIVFALCRVTLSV